MNSEKLTGSGLETLSRALLPTIKKLNINLKRCSKINFDGMVALFTSLLSVAPTIERLVLNLS
jgi:hypothetical protein